MATDPMTVFNKKYAVLTDKMSAAVRAGIAKGLTTKAAVEAALVSTGYAKKVETFTLDVMATTVTKNGVDIIEQSDLTATDFYLSFRRCSSPIYQDHD